MLRKDVHEIDIKKRVGDEGQKDEWLVRVSFLDPHYNRERVTVNKIDFYPPGAEKIRRIRAGRKRGVIEVHAKKGETFKVKTVNGDILTVG